MDEELRSLQRDLNFGVKTKVEQVNFLADQLASINSQITKLEVNGHKANDLRDQRANLIDELSKVINVEVKEIMEGNQESYKVYINGQLLVDGKDTNKLQVVPRATSNNPEDVADLYDIQWATGQNFYTDDPYLSGELKGYIDLRDGNNGKNVNVNGQTINYKGVPYYIQQLNNFVETFSSAFNGIHSSGSNKNGDQIDFFTYDPDMPARTFTVNALILEDVSNIAVNLDPTQGVENNELLLSLLNLRHDTTMFKQGKPESFMQAIMSEIAVDAKQANAFRTRQEDMLLSITNQRLSFSGVDLNEETMNMLKYQQAYNVAAKMISVMDEIYNVTINGMIK
jgi:flagellar hook-associated protein 1 FlgK